MLLRNDQGEAIKPEEATHVSEEDPMDAIKEMTEGLKEKGKERRHSLIDGEKNTDLIDVEQTEDDKMREEMKRQMRGAR